MDKIAECRDGILDLCCPDGAKEFVREAVASILLNLVEEKFTPTNTARDAIAALIKKLHDDYQPSTLFRREEVIEWLKQQQHP